MLYEAVQYVIYATIVGRVRTWVKVSSGFKSGNCYDNKVPTSTYFGLFHRWGVCQKDLPDSYVVACAVILQVLDLRPLVTMTANSYMVLGLRPVTVWLRAVVSADCT